MPKPTESFYQRQTELREFFSRLASEAATSETEALETHDYEKAFVAKGQRGAFRAASEILDHDLKASFLITSEGLKYEPSQSH